MVIVLLLLIVSRIIVSRTQRHAEGARTDPGALAGPQTERRSAEPLDVSEVAARF